MKRTEHTAMGKGGQPNSTYIHLLILNQLDIYTELNIQPTAERQPPARLPYSGYVLLSMSPYICQWSTTRIDQEINKSNKKKLMRNNHTHLYYMTYYNHLTFFKSFK